MFSMGAASGERVIVIGDSIAAQPDSWPRLLQGLDNLQVMAQSGRTIRDFTIPADLEVGDFDTVIYMLGSVDAYSQYPVRHSQRKLAVHLRFLVDRGFRVIVLLPPISSTLQPYIGHTRRMIVSTARDIGVEVRNIPVWDESLTTDGVHPTATLSAMVADWVSMLIRSS
jgi:hypothetical protein